MRTFEKTSKSSATGCVIENQAAKRQKLEGGLQRKVQIVYFLPSKSQVVYHL